jgi:hypothetical protein
MEEKMIGVDSMEDYGMIDEILLSFETLIGLLVHGFFSVCAFTG